MGFAEMNESSADLLAHDRSGPSTDVPVVLIHAGVADRRMWDGLLPLLVDTYDVVRLDLRGFGESTTRPADGWSHPADLLATLDALGVTRAHLVGASMGAGVAVEAALARPELAASLFLQAPGGSLIPRMTDDLRAFAIAENAALDAGDLDAGAQANVDTWLVGPGRTADAVPADVRALVHAMQKRAFELTGDWDEIEEAEPDPEPLDRLGELDVPTLVLTGGHDLTAIGEAADAVLAGVRGARHEHWDGVAHLPAMERPADVARLTKEWLASAS